MKIVIYLRVSTEDQAKEGYSLEVKREYLESFAKREGWDIFKIYQDDGYSGYTTDRPALKELLEDARQRKFNLVLVYKLDRFSRNLKDLLNLVEELSTYDIGFKSATEPFDTTTSTGKLMFQQLGSFAEFERNRIAERVFPGMVRGVLKGNWQGARYSLYGYKYNKEKKLLEVGEQEAKVVKLIYTLFLSGKSIRSITEYLTRKGYRNRNGNIFTTKLIGDILKNRIYTGKLVWNRHHYDKTKRTRKGYRYIKNPSDKVIIAQGKHKAIISEEDFELVQKKLSLIKVERRKKVGDYPLSGILYCAKCNHKYLGFSAISNHRTRAKKRWYRCSGPLRSFIRCKNKSVKADAIESQIAGILETLLKNDKLQTSRWMNMTNLDTSTIEIPKTEIERVKKELKDNLEKQSKLTDAYLENLISKDVFEQKIETLRSEEEELKKRIALYEIKAIEREQSKDYLDRVDEFISEYKPDKKEIDSLTKKQILGLLFKNIKIADNPDKRIGTFEFFAPFNFFYFEEEKRKQCAPNLKINRKVLSPQKGFISELTVVR